MYSSDIKRDEPKISDVEREHESVEEIVFDMLDALRDKWKKEYPNGSLPDKIGALSQYIIKEWYAAGTGFAGMDDDARQKAKCGDYVDVSRPKWCLDDNK